MHLFCYLFIYWSCFVASSTICVFLEKCWTWLSELFAHDKKIKLSVRLSTLHLHTQNAFILCVWFLIYSVYLLKRRRSPMLWVVCPSTVRHDSDFHAVPHDANLRCCGCFFVSLTVYRLVTLCVFFSNAHAIMCSIFEQRTQFLRGFYDDVCVMLFL